MFLFTKKKLHLRLIKVFGLVFRQILHVCVKLQLCHQILLLNYLHNQWSVPLQHCMHLKTLTPIQQIQQLLQSNLTIVQSINKNLVSVLHVSNMKKQWKSKSINTLPLRHREKLDENRL